MIYTLDSANQYEGLGRKSEQQFLEFVSCTKHLFQKVDIILTFSCFVGNMDL